MPYQRIALVARISAALGIIFAARGHVSASRALARILTRHCSRYISSARIKRRTRAQWFRALAASYLRSNVDISLVNNIFGVTWRGVSNNIVIG